MMWLLVVVVRLVEVLGAMDRPVCPGLRSFGRRDDGEVGFSRWRRAGLATGPGRRRCARPRAIGGVAAG